MYALNRVQIIGHLTDAPEIRQTPSGQSVGDLNIVTKHSFTKSSGESQTSKSFHNVVVWRGLADICGRFLKKGSQIFIAGRIQTDEWEDQKSGQKRYKTRVVADDVILLDPKNPSDYSGANPAVVSGLNQAQVIGNITRDPEVRQTPNGESVAAFGVATNFSWKSKDGGDQEKTEFHNVVAWGDLAQMTKDTFKKGKKVFISGRLQTRSWETPDGQKRYATEIIAEQALALGVASEDFGAPAMETNVSVSEPVVKENQVVPENPTEVPAVNYESGVKPEDLPF